MIRIRKCKDCNETPGFTMRATGASEMTFALGCSCRTEKWTRVVSSFTINDIPAFERTLAEKWNNTHKQTDFEKWLLKSMPYLEIGDSCALCAHEKEGDCPFNDDDCGSRDEMFKFDYTSLDADMKRFIVEVAKLMEADKDDN